MKKFYSLVITALLILCVLTAASALAEQAVGTDAYTVTFFDNFPGGSEILVRVAAGAKVKAPAAPQRLGYAFAGWFDAYEGGAAFDFEKPVTADAAVFAHWDKTANTVTFKYNDEGENQTVLVPAAPRPRQRGVFLPGLVPGRRVYETH